MIASVMLIGLPVSIAAYGAYKRHVPVHGVRQEQLDRIDGNSYVLLDVRAYNISDKEPVSEASICRFPIFQEATRKYRKSRFT